MSHLQHSRCMRDEEIEVVHKSHADLVIDSIASCALLIANFGSFRLRWRFAQAEAESR